jgi:RNA polymerase sigma-70 factor (ECF subfamily)
MNENEKSVVDQKEDQILFDLWIKGDPKGFSGLYNRYKNRVFGFLVKMTSDKEIAEDLLQDTFLAAMRNVSQFDRSRSFLSWIFGIAHKRTIDYFRHVKVENEHQADTDKSIGSGPDMPDDNLSNVRIRIAVNEAIKTLEPTQKEVFLLRELGDVPFKEIAKIMGCPINTSLGRMRLALKNLKKELKRKGLYGM